MLEGKIGQFLRERKLILSTSESCTGGLVSSRLIDVAGSSDYITLNFVTYANEAKERVLGVQHETLIKCGAVSKECVIEMAKGTLKAAQADIALCTSGVAGPGASENKPAGTLWISVAIGEDIYTKKVELSPEIPRIEMKQRFADEALEFLYECLIHCLR